MKKNLLVALSLILACSSSNDDTTIPPPSDGTYLVSFLQQSGDCESKLKPLADAKFTILNGQVVSTPSRTCTNDVVLVDQNVFGTLNCDVAFHGGSRALVTSVMDFDLNLENGSQVITVDVDGEPYCSSVYSTEVKLVVEK